MVERYVTSLYLTIPQIRLEKYRSSPASDLHMLTNYFWNMALCESLYPSLHAVELALRNSVHTALANRYGTEEWWDVPRILHSEQFGELDGKRKRYRKKYGVPITPGKLVAELTFGFWVTILSGHHVAWIWRWKKFRLLDQAFPHRAGAELGDVHKRFNDIRELRNRVMHYERVYDRADLRRDHADIHEAIQWISPDLHYGIHAVDSFQEVYELGWEQTYNKLHRMLGGP